MGFDLSNAKGGYLRFSPSGWALALTLAERFGWTPAGTICPQAEGYEVSQWTGEFATNEGQRVSTPDAGALADACARALASPDYVVVTEQTFRDICKAVDQAVGRASPERAPFGEAEILKFRGRLEELIAFCREGEFIIE